MNDYIIEAFCSAVRSGMFFQNEEEGDERLSFLCCELKENYSNNKAVQSLFKLALDLNMTPYLKRTGMNVNNNYYQEGDMIGIYFSNHVNVNNAGLQVGAGSKFCGVDVSEGTVNLQLFGTNANPTAIVSDLAHDYGLTLRDGSLRVSISDDRLNEIIDTFAKSLEG